MRVSPPAPASAAENPAERRPPPETSAAAVSTTSARPVATDRAAAASPYVRRKRAIAACQFCRLRKTKCDNARPVCGSCRHHRARCVYADGAEGDGLQVGLDEAAARHREVLERLDDIRSLLTTRRSPAGALSSTASEVGSWPGPLAGNNPDHAGAGPGAVETEGAFDRRAPSSGTAHLQYTKCESILKWPVLGGVMASDDAAIESFVLDAQVRGDGEEGREARGPAARGPAATARPLSSRAVSEEALVTLCQKFLALVNCRNPILDAHDLLSYARSVAEDGLGWDAKSCVVVKSESHLTKRPISST
ncbi:hypothetical protein VUR80DRAFT_8616 [Thermomyces stellatus]